MADEVDGNGRKVWRGTGRILRPGSQVDLGASLERFVAVARRRDLERLHEVEGTVLQRALDALAPSLVGIAEELGPDGLVTEDGARVARVQSTSPRRFAFDVTKAGETFRFETRVRGAVPEMDIPTPDGPDGVRRDPKAHAVGMVLRALRTSDQEAEAAPPAPSLEPEEVSVSLVVGAEVTKLHSARMPVPGLRGDAWGPVTPARILELHPGPGPYGALRSVLTATGRMDAVAGRARAIAGRDYGDAATDEADCLIVEVGQAIAGLDDGVPGPGMAARLAEVHLAGAAAALRDVVLSLPGIVDALAAAGHVSDAEGLDSEDDDRSYVTRGEGAETLVIGERHGAFRLVVERDGDGAVTRLDVAQSDRCYTSGHDDSDEDEAEESFVDGWGNRMGAYVVRDGTVRAYGPAPLDPYLPGRVTLLTRCVSYLVQRIEDEAAPRP